MEKKKSELLWEFLGPEFEEILVSKTDCNAFKVHMNPVDYEYFFADLDGRDMAVTFILREREVSLWIVPNEDKPRGKYSITTYEEGERPSMN